MMHMLAIGVGGLLKDLGVLSPMFCASCLMQKGGTRRKVKTHSHNMVASSMQFDFQPYPPAEFESKVKYLEAVLMQMDYSDEGTNILLHTDLPTMEPLSCDVAPRKVKRKRLAYLLGASTIEDGRITRYAHWCPLGCHATPKDAIDEINACSDAAVLDLSIGVPALNKWIKLFKPLSQWQSGILLPVT